MKRRILVRSIVVRVPGEQVRVRAIDRAVASRVIVVHELVPVEVYGRPVALSDGLSSQQQHEEKRDNDDDDHNDAQSPHYIRRRVSFFQLPSPSVQ